LEDASLDHSVRDRLLDFWAVALFHNIDSVDASRHWLEAMISRQQYREISHVLWFIWRSASPEFVTKQSDTVLTLWTALDGYLANAVSAAAAYGRLNLLGAIGVLKIRSEGKRNKRVEIALAS
jgi:hypothetical protein